MEKMSKQINKKSLIILIIIQIGYFIRGHLPSMCYYTPFLSNYAKYPATYFFYLLDYVFLFLAVSVGIFGIKNKKTLLKIFGLIQPMKLVTDIVFKFIPVSIESGRYYTYPLLNYYLLIIGIIFINTYFINHGKINRQIFKPIAFCGGAVLFQFLIYIIPVYIYFSVQISQIQRGNAVSNTEFPFIMIAVQFVVCNILQVLGGCMLIRYDNSAAEYESSGDKKQKLIIYSAVLVGSIVLLLLYYLWLNMPNGVIEIIRFGFGAI